MFWWLFGGVIRWTVTIALLVLVIFLITHFTPLDEFYRAKAHRLLGNVQGAIYWYEEGLRKHPKGSLSDQARYELVLVYLDSVQPHKALYHLSQCDRLTSEQKRQVLFALARAFGLTGDAKKAAEHFRAFAAAFQNDEKAPEALYRAGEAFSQSGQDKLAIAAWKQCAERYPRSVWTAKSLWALALAEQKRGNDKAFVKACRRLSEDHPSTPEAARARWNLTLWHLKKGERTEAFRWFQTAVKESPHLIKEWLSSEQASELLRQFKGTMSDWLSQLPSAGP